MFLGLGLVLLLLWLGGFFVFHVTALFIHILLSCCCFDHLPFHAWDCFRGLRDAFEGGARRESASTFLLPAPFLSIQSSLVFVDGLAFFKCFDDLNVLDRTHRNGQRVPRKNHQVRKFTGFNRTLGTLLPTLVSGVDGDGF